MNVYMFLLDTNDKTEYEAVSSFNMFGRHMYLYAITNDKKLAKSFSSTRDMDKFKLEIFETDSEEEYTRFLHDNSLYDCELTTSTFPTQTQDGEYFTIGYVKVVCTIRESDLVEYDFDSDIINNMENVASSVYDVMKKRFLSLELVDAFMLYPKIFNKEINDALNYLNFSEFMEDTTYQIDNMETCEYSLNEDKLKVFCKKFFNTYKEGLKL